MEVNDAYQDGTVILDSNTGRVISKLYGIKLTVEDSRILDQNKRL